MGCDIPEHLFGLLPVRRYIRPPTTHSISTAIRFASPKLLIWLHPKECWSSTRQETAATVLGRRSQHPQMGTASWPLGQLAPMVCVPVLAALVQLQTAESNLTFAPWGQDAAYIHPDGSIRTGNGTSFSSPILCGAATALWSAHPEQPAWAIRKALLASASQWTEPDTTRGYGIPNLWTAHLALGGTAPTSDQANVVVYPNPVPSSSQILRVMFPRASAPFCREHTVTVDLIGIHRSVDFRRPTRTWQRGIDHAYTPNLCFVDGNLFALVSRGQRWSAARGANNLGAIRGGMTFLPT